MQDTYPLRQTDEYIDFLADVLLFSALDAIWDNWQMAIAVDYKKNHFHQPGRNV